MAYVKVIQKKKCSTEGCEAITMNDKCSVCCKKVSKPIKVTKKCATPTCSNGVRTREYCSKCDSGYKKKLTPCHGDGCSRNCHGEYCALCTNRFNHTAHKQAKITRKKMATELAAKTSTDETPAPVIEKKDEPTAPVDPHKEPQPADQQPTIKSSSLVKSLKEAGHVDNIASISASSDSGDSNEVAGDDLTDLMYEFADLLRDYDIPYNKRVRCLETIAAIL